MTDAKQRIAILGGGVSALCAAFALSEIDPTGEKYDITLYHMGWRLGGKCASGRNAKFGQRIEEHGLHVWAGFYENAFTVMRAAIKALNQPPFLTIGDAFKRQNEIFYAERVDDEWLPWPFWFQPNEDPAVFPGRDDLWAPDNVLPSISELMMRAIAAIIFGLDYYTEHWPGDHKTEVEIALAQMPPEQRLRLARISIAGQTAGGKGGHPLLTLAVHVGRDLDSVSEKVRRDAQADMIALLRAFHVLVKQYQNSGGLDVALRRLLVLINLGICMLLGMLKHDCIWDGIEVLDPLDFRAFLAEEDEGAADSVIITALYEYIFAYKGGSRAAPLVSASTAVQGLLRLFFTYKGAFFFKAVYGMGDTICTPLYRLLKQRGVKFQFFHKVTALEPAADGSHIATVVIDRQVDLADGVNAYDPFVMVKDFPSWPSTPRWKQLKDGEKLAAAGYDFENAYGPPFPPQPPAAGQLRLQAGIDFDKVILGISIGALGEICAPLIAQKTAWADMIANLATVRTQALQLWMATAREDLGGPYVTPTVPDQPMGPVVTTFQEPFDTYSDMTQLLPAEDWRAGTPPLSVGYFCGVFADDAAPNNAAIAAAKVKEGASAWMTTWLDGLWTLIGNGESFHWDWLHSPSGLTGPARLDDQYWRCNINPSDRYVQSLPGTLKYRMEAGNSGYANLVLAGDWTRVPEINAGCVEVAAMSGLAAASAASGISIPIVATSLKPAPINRARASVARSKPRYINYSGWATLPAPPFFCNDTNFYSFSIAASQSACQDFLDRTYNVVAGYPRFRAMAENVMLNIVESGKAGATTPPFLEEGTAAGTDIGFWLLVASYPKNGSAPTFGLIPAYLFVDSAWSVMAAREVWGFPKVYSVMDLPNEAPSFGPFRVSTLAIAKFAPTAQANRQQVLKLTGSQINAGAAGAESSAVDSFKRRFLGAAADDAMIAAALAEPWPFAGKVFFIKQTRSAEDSVSASYQELLQGSLSLTGLLSIPEPLLGEWTLELNDFDSCPFIHDLGLGSPTNGKLVLTTNLGLFAQINFTVDLATVMV